MTNIAKGLRSMLAEVAHIATLQEEKRAEASDGTVKLALGAEDGRTIETVLIPDGNKLTQCISTQVGCRMGCGFCATATLGFERNLTAAEIAYQVTLARRLAQKRDTRISNLVYMGMGEPLDNYEATISSLQILMHPLGHNFSSRRITLSTVGHVEGLRRLGTEQLQVNLAVSLNAPTQQQRAKIMPVARKWPLDQLMRALRRFPLEKRRRITIEYVLIDGLNDSVADAEKLARLLSPLRCKINVIKLNPFPGCRWRPPSDHKTIAFQNALRRHDLTVILRKSRGAEIQAGCGQLAGASLE
jgi:23S rRNA (adenine2503-C2)-methyltransferase